MQYCIMNLYYLIYMPIIYSKHIVICNCR
uniref:Uncharacterized protein n=1 Tax=Anguilla anguilla TaxID=7936 RepID=A0A0E9SS61_ANGAN